MGAPGSTAPALERQSAISHALRHPVVDRHNQTPTELDAPPSPGTPPGPTVGRMGKVIDDIAPVLTEHLRDGMTLAVGGFGLCGIPTDLITVVRDSGVKDLTIVSNNLGIDGKGLGLLLENSQIARVLASYVGENRLFMQQYIDGAIEVEFVPQGTLAERLRAGGSGIAGFYTRTGVGTIVADGKPTMDFDGETFVLERGIVADIALVHAHTADTDGNLLYRRTARNFNPLAAMSGRVTFAEAEHLVELGALDPDTIHTPGVFVHHVTRAVSPTDIEQRTVRPRPVANAEEN